MCNSINNEILYTTPFLQKVVNWNKFNIPVTVEIDGLDTVIGFVQSMELQGPDFVYFVEMFNENILGDTSYVIIPHFIAHETQYLEEGIVVIITGNIINFEVKVSTNYKYQVEEV